MKTILIPTNFSDVSRHATNYAIKLIGKDLSRVILLNAFEQPKTGRTFQVSLIDILKRTSEKGLMEDELNIKEEFPGEDFKIEVVSSRGDISNCIKYILEHEKIDLVVMGSKGDQEFVDIFVESVTARVISEIDHPMLIVPPNARTKKQLKIVLASDLKKITDKSVISELLYLSKLHNADIEVLNISNIENGRNEKMESMLDDLLNNVSHNYNYRRNTNIHTGIYKFLKEIDAEVLTLVKRKGKGSLVARLFHKSVSRRIAKNVNQVLLLLTDQDYDSL